MRPPKPTSVELNLMRENSTLKTEIICLRRELTNKQGHVARLEYLLCARAARIDEHNGKLEQAREQSRKLEQEAEHLAALIAAAPDHASILATH